MAVFCTKVDLAHLDFLGVNTVKNLAVNSTSGAFFDLFDVHAEGGVDPLDQFTAALEVSLILIVGKLKVKNGVDREFL